MFPKPTSHRQSALTPISPAQGEGPPGPPTPVSPATGRRTSHACDRCRKMRTKCSGSTRCQKCIKDDAVCVYLDRKRERNKKDLVESTDRINSLQEENSNLVAAIRTLTSDPNFSAETYPDVMNLISDYNSDWQRDDTASLNSRTNNLRSPTITSSGAESSRSGRNRERGGEERIASSIGSPGRQGELHQLVDLDEGRGASGYVGKLSEMSWMQRAREYLVEAPKLPKDVNQAQLDQHTNHAQTLTYFMDDLNLLSVDEDFVDPIAWPPYQVAVLLTEAYFHANLGVFQFVLREEFLDTMATIAGQLQNSPPTWQHRRWLSVANIIWAIGSRWLHTVKLDNNFPEHHLVYYARARALGLDHRVLFDHPDVEMVEGIGLLAFYLLVNGSISRAWNILGNAIRHATALGLHLKVTDEAIGNREREKRARIWYSLYTLEVLIAETTGRPQSIQAKQITVPTDVLKRVSYKSGFVEGAQNSGEVARRTWLDFMRVARDAMDETSRDALARVINLAVTRMPPSYLTYHVRLCWVSDEISTKLYTGGSGAAWSETQDLMRVLQSSLEQWESSLPPDLAIRPGESLGADASPSKADDRARIALVMYFYSVSMMLYRPCLCEIRIEDESDQSRGFNQESAYACVQAALEMIHLLPDDPAPHLIAQFLPWWTVLHYFCQAAGVLLLELCLDSQHCQGESKGIMRGLKKALTYMWCMSEDSMSAYRAWRIFKGLVDKVRERYGNPEILDMPEDAPRPAAWSDNCEQSVAASLA